MYIFIIYTLYVLYYVSQHMKKVYFFKARQKIIKT